MIKKKVFHGENHCSIREDSVASIFLLKMFSFPEAKIRPFSYLTSEANYQLNSGLNMSKVFVGSKGTLIISSFLLVEATTMGSLSMTLERKSQWLKKMLTRQLYELCVGTMKEVSLYGQVEDQTIRVLRDGM